ncbi:MAG: hypothetical protein M3071_05300, partial [Actinomycetota bacterium]|nr:hypothetical protein [Actinomycetota bacterium]
MSTDRVQSIVDEVMSWPGVSAHDHRFGGVEFRSGTGSSATSTAIRSQTFPSSARARRAVASGGPGSTAGGPDSGWVTVDLDSAGEGTRPCVCSVPAGVQGPTGPR